MLSNDDHLGPGPAEVRGAALADRLRAAGASIVASLPDSWMTALINAIDQAPGMRHVRVAREDDGAAICAGAALGGVRGVLVCQNAGVLLSANGLAAYAGHHQIPFLVLAVARGGPDDGFFYQAYKDPATRPMLEALRLPHHVIEGPSDDHLITEGMTQAWMHRRPTVLLLTRRALLGEDPDETR